MPQVAGVTGQQAASADPAAIERWRDLRAARDLQFSPAQPWHPQPDPPWLGALGRWLEGVFRPVARMFGGAWPWVEKGLIALAVVGALWLVWVLVRPLLKCRRGPVEHDSPWVPGGEEAMALLRDAEALAGAGDFAGAIHLLLRRCVAQLGAARPGLIHPASTAREIAAMPVLPDAARGALRTIAGRVEASRYALRGAGEADWRAARDAYADFARVRLAEMAA